MIVGKGAGVEGNAIAKAVVPQPCALPVEQVEVEIVQVGASQSDKPQGLLALVVDRYQEPLQSFTKAQ